MASSSKENRGIRSMVESMQLLCLSDKFADVTFTFGRSEKLHAHRVVLSMRSPVFEAMLYGPLSAEKECEIKIEDADAETFSTFLRFIYTDTIDLDGASVIKILYLANKYSMDILEERCADFLKSSIDVDNVCTIHEHAAIFNQTELQNRCFEFILDHGEAVIQSDNFLTITKATLHRLISHDNLSTNEKLIFDAAVRWSRKQCQKNCITESAQNMRTQLGDVFYSIRFPLVPMETFAQEICPCQLLTTQEENHLFRYMVSTKSSTNQGEVMVGGFSNRVRKGKYVVVNFREFEVVGQDRYPSKVGKGYCKVKQDRHAYNILCVSLNVTPAYPVKLHAIVFKDLQMVSNIKLINVKHQHDTFELNRYDFREDDFNEEVADEYEEVCSTSNLEFKTNCNKIEFKQPLELNGACNIAFTLSNYMGICTTIQTNHVTTDGLNVKINYNSQLFDQLIFSR